MMKKILLLFTLCFVQATQANQLSAGPMLGHVALRGANIWVQTDTAGEVAITYWATGEEKNKHEITAKVNPKYGNTHTFNLTRLEPGTTYQYRIAIDGKKQKNKPSYQFTTQTLWQWRTDPPDFSVLAGSCTFINEKIYDRPGTPYGSGHEAMFGQIAQEDAEVMLWIGDNWYYHEVDYDAEQNLL